MENRKVVFICAPYDAKDSIAHAKEIALVSHFRALIEDMYHYKTYAPGSYLTGPSKEAKDFRLEIDPREDLVQKLLEYKMYKYMSYELKDRLSVSGKVLYKDPTIPEEVAKYEQPVDLEELVGDLTLTRLNAIFQSLMRRQNDKIDPIRSKFGQIEQEEVSLDEKMMDLRTYAQEHATFRFSELMQEQKGKIQMIVTFLAVLELMKTGELTVVQEHLFDDMLITSQL